MFHKLFTRSDALQRQRVGPLAEDRGRYLSHLADQGMARSSLRAVAEFLLGVADYLRLNERPGETISYSEIEQQAVRWANRRHRPPQIKDISRTRARFIWHATRWLQFLGRYQPPCPTPSPYADRLAAFANYMRQERGLSPRTINTRCQRVQGFLECLGIADHAFHRMSPAQIDEALRSKIQQSRFVPVTVRSYISSLRTFLRYAEAQGWCRKGLANALQGPRIYAHATLPLGPSWDKVQQLLTTTVEDRPKEIRDRAILMLLAMYGFRAGEVVQLRLADFNWERELLFLTRPKQRRAQSYPLARSVGDAVLRYLQKVRPRSAHREVFLTLRAPFRPLCSDTLCTSVVGPRLRSLGVSIPHYGPHALRHACATYLLSQGLSLKEIGDHLGHRHPDTTRIYAKVDLVGLRQVADFDLGGLQ
jgi:site-specific recombinase XerD